MPGNPDDSELLKRVRLALDDNERMPPKEHGEPIAPSEIDAPGHWIKAGGGVVDTEVKNGLQQASSKATLNYHHWLRERIAGNVPFNLYLTVMSRPPTDMEMEKLLAVMNER